MSSTELVVLVDRANRVIGAGDKLRVHKEGRRHRAFSIFLVDGSGSILLQQRSLTKYHSAGLWANTCCGHPRPGERTIYAARRRLSEELGLTADLVRSFRTAYRAELENGLSENEIVDVYFGRLEAKCEPNPLEVCSINAMTLGKLARSIKLYPSRHAFWLKHYVHNHSAEMERAITSLAEYSPKTRR